jgi:heme peroxidase
MTHLGSPMRGLGTPQSTYHASGRFGRLFPFLSEFLPDCEEVRDALLILGESGGMMDAKDRLGGSNPDSPDNPDIPAGFTFLGQFIDHDITFDPTSSLERQIDPEAIANFRTPLLELDCIYGAGPQANPHLYDRASRGTKFLIDEDFPSDLPRNSQMTALVGDPRNDENLIVSQMHLAFLKFHNAVVDLVSANGTKGPDKIFREAQRLVRWHYQWIVLHEFLPHTVGKHLMEEMLADGLEYHNLKNNLRFYDWRNEPFIPVEFSAAAYRFGHSQVLPGYKVNAGFQAPILDPNQDPKHHDPEDLSGGKRAERRYVDWSYFFRLGGNTPQSSKRIDTKLSSPLFKLPFPPNAPHRSLAQRNLLRHLTFGLPSGQAVARAMGIQPLTSEELKEVAEFGMHTATPLWFYTLREAQERADGKHLGPVGGRLVAEVLVGLLVGDPLSFVRCHPRWCPTLGQKGEFGMADLLRTAGVVQDTEPAMAY